MSCEEWLVIREADNNRSKPSHFPRQKKDDERPTYSIYKKMA
uniref:Uncharacterized protein n=1 Tax=Meloidogyne enterolobii TaxID=390850 RepID=A0A6V7X4W4_MELEN|nr:unnamed protein product [Meloidogyne enterolobii]